MADRRELAWRLSLGPALIAAFALLFFADARAGDAAPWLFVLALLLALRSVWELVDLLRAKDLSPNLPLLALCTIAVVAGNWLPVWTELRSGDATGIGRLGFPMLAYALSSMLLFANALVRYRGPGRNLELLGLEVLSLTYVAVFLSATAQLRWIARPELCYLPLASLVVVTKCGDTSAFFTGRAIGGRKLIPLISPGKTIAGAWGALAGGAVGGWLCLSLAPRWFADQSGAAWYWSVFYGVIIAGIGIVGDLAESLIKRDVGRKDAAALMPGFGGLLDLVDSVIFTGPAAYLLWLLLPLGG